ncbi:hypothetical protein ATO6_02005 [Oceanicola sp. 22II-s10i]|uniref:SDR family NAD(P)-dependent oxidoreductase n=1 Tax=Oceanicola sp. 22II-s10i TaxID=1317116 RepID=UPI000B527E27|nr:glucose 1-dehydrogenase [Oceanicola sp. 22II-s10i]OWU85717.1 hypothetical protein ATO6_02005 [Oceanicola sp. 22II-s10i]
MSEPIFKGRTAIVTGAAEGIGRAIATHLAECGANVVIADRQDPTPTAEALKARGLSAIPVSVDVADPEQVRAMVDAGIAAFGEVSILVNNAGIFSSLLPKPSEEIPLEEWERVMAVNVTGVFLCCTAVLPSMRRAGGGSIVNIGSGTVFKGTPLKLHYVTSKAAILGLTRSLAKEVGKDRIRVNSVAPGYTLSDGMLRNEHEVARTRDKTIAERALPRDIFPADIVGAVSMLASDASEAITGQTLVVDGGVVMH